MKRIGLKHLKIYKDRHGTTRCYHRKACMPIDLVKFPLDSPSFIAEYVRITNLLDKKSEAKAGTLGKLINEYRKHAAFTDLAVRTQADYQRIFNYLQPIDDTPLIRFNAPLIVQIRDKAATKMGRKWGNYTKTVLSLLFAWGLERGYIDNNPAFKIKGLKRPKSEAKPNRPWTDVERENVLAALPPHMILPFALMMFCGLDPKDTLELNRSAVKDDMIDTKRAKTSQPVWIPLPLPVKAAIETTPQHSAITICANSLGKPWTIDGFNSNWQKIRKKLLEANQVEEGLTLKGLRHTVATILAEMGYDDRTIADMLGQKTLAMAQHYSDRANRSKKLTGVVKNFDVEVKRRKKKSV